MTKAANHSSLLVDETGAVYVEFLVVVVPLWIFFLSLVQLAFLAHANLVVKHATDAAVRSAAVVLADDPNEYGGQPEMTIERGRITVGELADALDGLSSASSGPSTSDLLGALSDRTFANLGRSRLNTIRLAAHVPLMALAPVNVGHDSSPTLRKSVGSARRLASSLYYQPLAVAVTFPGLEGDRVPGPEVTVRVTYAYQCTVPVARNLLCGSFSQPGGLERFDQAFFPFAQEFIGGHFKRIQHESTLLVQDAPYQYRPRGS